MGVNGQNIRPAKNYNILPKTQELVKRFSNAKTIITLFSNPYTLGKFENLENAAALVQTFQETPFTQEAAAQAIFGATPITGKLPVTVNTAFKYNDGISTKALQRFEYTVPEAVGIDSKYLGARIDSIVTTAIDRKATPGAVVLVAKNGKVIFHKAYGKHTYEGNQKVALTDLYDLASVTKISTSVAR
jgi:CubicO group peptidase (beta-lactamase class C family)